MKKILRNVGLILAVAFATNANAQIPDYGVWPAGMSFTDINGVTYDVDSILDLGQPVFIDAFADWCGPCWNYHQTHQLNQLYTQYGPDGTGELMVFGIEADPSTPAGDITSTSNYGDWSVGTDYPLANDDNIANAINLAYFPTIIKICPDRMVTEVGQQNPANLYASANTCEGVSTASNDPRILASTSDEQFCSGSDANMSVILQNNSTQPLTEATIEVFEGGNSILSLDWTGNLDPYGVEEVTLGTVNPTQQTTYSIKITSTNDDTSNDEVQAMIKPADVLEVGSTNKEVTFVLDVDDYTSDIGLVFNEGTLPSTDYVGIHNAAANNPSSVLGFIQVGSLNDGMSPLTRTWTVNNEGCHFAMFVDYFGDGYAFNKPNASIKINGIDNSYVSVDPDFGEWTYTVFDVQFVSDLGINSEALGSSFKVYPNPASTSLNLDFELNNSENVNISVLNTVGQVVATQNLTSVVGTQHTTMDVSSLDAGMYIVKLKTETGETTKRVSIVR